MRRPLLLDLFCGAGGATKGYQRAGFYVVGVDSKPQPHYCGDAFVQMDAIAAIAALSTPCSRVERIHGTATNDPGAEASWRLSHFAAIHASPPCHDHSTVTGRNRKAAGAKGTAWMLNATIRRLQDLNLPWVVENVETAKFATDVYRIRLCGSMFGLDVRRHRWFATNIAMLNPACAHRLQTPRFRSLDSRRVEGSLATVVGVHGHLNYPGEFELRQQAMGIDWMTNTELSQAIPPAYTEWIGQQLLQHLERVA